MTPVDDDCVGIAILSSQHGGFDAHFHEFPALPGIAYWVVNTAPTELRAHCDKGSRAALPGESYTSVTRRVTRTHLPEGLGPAFGAAELLVQCVVAERPGDYDHQWRRMTRRYRALTEALLRAGACPPLRAGIVPAAHAWPNLFSSVVNLLAQ